MSDWEAALLDAPRAWAGIRVEGFAEHARALHVEGGADAAHLADLYLAMAAGRGDRAALRALDDRVLARIDPAVRAVDPSAHFVDEVRQALRVLLLVGPPPRIQEYRARGPLIAWASVAATRLALNLKRGVKPTTSTEDVLVELASRDPDPELEHLRTTYRAEFATALREAVAALPERGRALLRLHFADGMPLARIGALYRVHESTASRWIRAALDDLAADSRRRLGARLSLSPATLDSVARLVQSGLDLSLHGLLRDP